MILSTVMEADHRSCTDGIADECPGENHAHIHHHAVGGHTVFPGVVYQLQVEEGAHQAHGDVAHKFRRAVDGGLGHGAAVVAGRAEPQEAGIFPKEVHQWHNAAHGLAYGRG